MHRSCGIVFSAVLLVLSPPALAGDLAPFTEEGLGRGLTYEVTDDWVPTFGHGVGFADLDGDGDCDLIAVGGVSGLVGVFENDGQGFFTDRSAQTGIPANTHYSSVTAADYDNDGDLDLHITATEQNSDRLMRNDGGFQFVDVTDEAGVGDAYYGYGVGWTDFNKDGWLDFFRPNRDRPGEDRLYRNNGDGTFTDVAEAMGVLEPGSNLFQGTFFDFDLDRDQDLYVANDRGADSCEFWNHLYRHDGTVFTDISEQSNSDVCMDAMCVAVGDFDGNGWQDIYITNTPPGNELLLNQGDGTFDRAAGYTGTGSYRVGWASQFLDVDNDGHLDLFSVNMDAPNRLYWHGGNGWPCADLAADFALDDAGVSFGASMADIDGDGDVDLAVSNAGETLKLFINHEGSRHHWLRVRLIDRAQHDGVGAVVEISAGGETQMREMVFNAGYKSQNEHVLHFGLGETDIVDVIDVKWADGGNSRLTNVISRQVLTIKQGTAADLTDLRMLEGTLIAGGLAELQSSDDAVVLTEARVTGEVAQPHLLRMQVGASTNVSDVDAIDIRSECQTTDFVTMWLYLQDWVADEWVQIDEFALGLTEEVNHITVVGADRFVRDSDGRIEIEAKGIAFFPFTLGGFNGMFDHIELSVR